MSFSPPIGSAFHTTRDVPLSTLGDELRRVLRLLIGNQSPPPNLRLYHDWWEHDGLHFCKHGISSDEVFAMVAMPRAIVEATPTDDSVFVGIAPEDGSWYLRFRAEWDADDQHLVGRFAILVCTKLTDGFKTSIAAEGCRLIEEPTDIYYRKAMAS